MQKYHLLSLAVFGQIVSRTEFVALQNRVAALERLLTGITRTVNYSGCATLTIPAVVVAKAGVRVVKGIQADTISVSGHVSTGGNITVTGQARLNGGALVSRGIVTDTLRVANVPVNPNATNDPRVSTMSTLLGGITRSTNNEGQTVWNFPGNIQSSRVNATTASFLSLNVNNVPITGNGGSGSSSGVSEQRVAALESLTSGITKSVLQDGRTAWTFDGHVSGNKIEGTTLTAYGIDIKGAVNLGGLTVSGPTKLNTLELTGEFKVNGAVVDHGAMETRLAAVEETVTGIAKESINGISKWMFAGSVEASSLRSGSVVASSLTTTSSATLNGLNASGMAVFNNGLTGNGDSTFENLVVNGNIRSASLPDVSVLNGISRQASGNDITWVFNGRIQSNDITTNNAVMGTVTAASANVQGNVAVQGSITSSGLNVQQRAQLPTLLLEAYTASFTGMTRFVDPYDSSKACTVFNTWVPGRNSNFLNADCGLAMNGQLNTGLGIEARGDILGQSISARGNLVVGGNLYAKTD